MTRKLEVLGRILDERTRRLAAAAAEVDSIGFVGVSAVAQASGLSRGTVIRGLAELKTASKPARGSESGAKERGESEPLTKTPPWKRDLEALVGR